MKISLEWIKEILPNLKANAKAVEKRLTAAGLEVEGVTLEADGLAGVISAEVRALAPHPDAERLRVATVFDGERELIVVCGAANVAEGQKVAFAPVGTTLPNGLRIERRAVRGVESSGMICSEEELGLADASEGILVLKPRTRPGKPIAEVLGLEDVIFELSVTPNRPDALSHLGLARELAALHELSLPKPSVRVREAKRPASALAKVEVKDKRCTHYLGRVITGVKVGPSPAWLKRRLRAVGQRSISNVVDATNLVLLELGHPLHAFDLERLEGHKVVVRAAAPGEALTTLDGVARTLSEEDLVIADAAKPVALAGVMGGESSEVQADTTQILLECAVFDPRSVRRTARRHGLHTEASHRFERGVDAGAVELAVDRCAQLIAELGGGQVQQGRLGTAKDVRRPVVAIRPERASLVLGREVDKREVRSVLTALGLRPVKAPPARAPTKGGRKKAAPASGGLCFEVPSWRVDLVREEDLIEEVARVTGYDQIPALMPPSSSAVWTGRPGPGPASPGPGPADPSKPEARREQSDRSRVGPASPGPGPAEGILKRALVAEGFLETISLAFGSRAQAEALRVDVDRAVSVENPLKEESQLMRFSMVPALLRALRLNQDQQPSVTDVRIFEVGRTFQWGDGPGPLPEEETRAALVMRGSRYPASWAVPKELLDAYDLKGVVEAALGAFRVEGVEWVAAEVPWLHPRSATRLEHQGRTLGLLGELHPDVMARHGLEGPAVFLADLDVAALAAVAGGVARFAPLPKLPPAQRDLSFFLDREVPAAKVLEAVRSAAPAHLERVELFDVYEGRGVPEGKKSLAIAMTFRAPDRTLTDPEVESVQGAIVEGLTSTLGAQIRSGT